MSPEEAAKRVRAQAEKYIDLCGEYTRPYEREKFVRSWVKKEQAADGLVQDVTRRAGPLVGKNMLELGFGSGLHIPAFVRAGAHVYGLEVNSVLLEIAQENMRERELAVDLRLYDGIHMPYENDFLDYIFATSVLEHVSDARAIMREADRVLKPGGKFYMSFPNRWAPREAHTGFWLMHYVPRPVARMMFRACGSNAFDELDLHLLSYFSLRRMLRGTHLRVVYETNAASPARRMLKKMLARAGVHHSAILKTVMVVLEKRV